MGIRKVYGVVLPTGSAVQAPPNSTNFDVKLGDAAGARFFRVVDSATAEQFKVDSDGNVTVQGTLASSGTFTVGGTFTASSSGLVSGGLTVSKTITGSSALSVAAASTFSAGVTVGGTLTASSALSVAAASTFSAAVSMSSGLAVTAASTFSAGVTIGGTITGSSNASVAATLTASSNLTASRGVTAPRAVASSAANLAAYGLLNITSTAAESMIIDAPVAGREVWIYKTANSTFASTITTNATGTVTWDGSNTALTFNAQNQFAHAIGNSSTRWLLLTTTGVGGYTLVA